MKLTSETGTNRLTAAMSKQLIHYLTSYIQCWEYSSSSTRSTVMSGESHISHPKTRWREVRCEWYFRMGTLFHKGTLLEAQLTAFYLYSISYVQQPGGIRSTHTIKHIAKSQHSFCISQSPVSICVSIMSQSTLSISEGFYVYKVIHIYVKL